MNRRGLYTTAVGLAIIVLITGTVLYMGHPVREIKSSARANSLKEANFLLLEARYLLDKAAADALADAYFSYASNVGRCSSLAISSTDFESRIQQYFAYVKAGILDRSAFDCTFGTPSFSYPKVGRVDVSFAMSCADKLGGKASEGADFEATIERQFTFSKKLDTASNVGSCTITVTDLQSGLTEVPNQRKTY